MSIADKLEMAAQNVSKVYESGKKACYNAFWDNFQQNGARTNYWYGFSGYGWNQANLIPKYKITFSEAASNTQYATGMFYRCNGGGGSANPIDFSKIADKFDFSGLKSARNLFDSASIINIYADLSSVAIADMAFARSWGGYLDKITVKVTAAMTSCSNMFLYCGSLKELTFADGSEIACNGMDLSSATALTKESIVSVIEALSASTNGLAVTLSQKAVNNMTFPVTSTQTGTVYDSWDALIAAKSNWTVSLV